MEVNTSCQQPSGRRRNIRQIIRSVAAMFAQSGGTLKWCSREVGSELHLRQGRVRNIAQELL